MAGSVRLLFDPRLYAAVCRERGVVRHQFFGDRRHRRGPLLGICLLGSAGGGIFCCDAHEAGADPAPAVAACCGLPVDPAGLSGPGLCPGDPLSAGRFSGVCLSPCGAGGRSLCAADAGPAAGAAVPVPAGAGATPPAGPLGAPACCSCWRGWCPLHWRCSSPLRQPC